MEVKVDRSAERVMPHTVAGPRSLDHTAAESLTSNGVRVACFQLLAWACVGAIASKRRVGCSLCENGLCAASGVNLCGTS